MKRNRYSFSRKAALCAAGGICAGIIAICMLAANYWLDGAFQISTLGRSFEETAVFLRDVEDEIRSKVDCAQNIDMFQTDGVTNLNKEIDIHQYVSGVNDSANRNENLTYMLSDLINFYPESGALKEAVESARDMETSSDPRDQGSWDTLAGQAEQYETILPLSGSTLAQTAKASATPYETLIEYYEALLKTSSELNSRYRSYTEEMDSTDGAGSVSAPANVSYYIENTQTKTTYTNLGVQGVAAARQAISEDAELTLLFDGIRTLDIMVADSDSTLNSEAADWFMDAVFTGSNERVVIAVNTDYTAGDKLRDDYLSYKKRGPVVTASFAIALAALAAMIWTFVISIRLTGRSSSQDLIPLKGFDTVPTEIAAGLAAASGIAWYYVSRAFIRMMPDVRLRQTGRVVFWAVMYELLLLSLLGLARRIKWRKLWDNSVAFTLARVSSQVLEARAASTRMLIIYTGFILLNFLLLRIPGSFGVALVIVIDLALLLYLLRDQLGKLSVRAGLREISKGKLDYKIDTAPLTGDSLEMAQAVNEMGDGLKKAVDSIIQSERQKTDLITNVSHDLKTPLTSIINYVDLLKRLDIKDERAEEYIGVLERKSMRLKSLIQDLIDASRISSGMVKIELSPLDLRSMVLMAAGEFEDRLEEADLRTQLEEQHPGRAVMINADGSQLWRVLDNLLSNIAKYAKGGTAVRISISSGDGRACASFENESARELDMSGEELEERFVRGDLSRSSEGSGLGLSIAKSLTELMGGEFSVVTDAHTFRASVSFPLIPDVKVS